jgi:multisubunit Na+/H+ antiporter MnhE subunit
VRASASKGAGRTWLSNEIVLRKGVAWSEIGPDIIKLLVEAYDAAEQWSEKELNTKRRIDVAEILRRQRK